MNPDEQENLQADAPANGQEKSVSDQQPPSTGAVRPLENSQLSGGGSPYTSVPPPSIGGVRLSNNSQHSDDHGSDYYPPSTGAVRPLENSQVSGDCYASSGKAPSIGAMSPLDDSQNGNPMISEDAQQAGGGARMRATAPKYNIRMINPNAFKRNNDAN